MGGGKKTKKRLAKPGETLLQKRKRLIKNKTKQGRPATAPKRKKPALKRVSK